MAFNIVIPGANFSNLGNPRVESFIAGFPKRNMRGLYLMEDGAVGSTPTILTDSSGNGAHAPVLPGADIQKTEQGVTSAHTGAIFTGSIIGSVLTVTSVNFGGIEVGKALLGPGVTNNPLIQSQTSGTPGGEGVYQLSAASADRPSQLLQLRNNGFYAKPPILYDRSYSLVMVVRNHVPAPAAGPGRYPNLHLPAGTASAGASSMNEAFGEAAFSTAGVLLLNQDTTVSTDVAEIGVLNRKTNVSGTGWGPEPTQVRRPLSVVGHPRKSWLAFASSAGLATGTVIARLAGVTRTVVDLPQLTEFVNAVKATQHLFGFGRYAGANCYPGDVGLFGLWDGAKSEGELDSLIGAAKARMALRGVTAH